MIDFRHNPDGTIRYKGKIYRSGEVLESFTGANVLTESFAMSSPVIVSRKPSSHLKHEAKESLMYKHHTKRPGSFLSESLQPQNWTKLADRRTPWPEGLDPKQALRELAVFMEYRMIEDTLHAQGRSIDTLIQSKEI